MIRLLSATSTGLRRLTLGLAAASLVTLGSAAQAQTKIDFWDQIWGPAEYIDTARKLVDQFNKEHPEIKVEYRSVPWANWYQTYSSAIAAGTAPDLSTGAGYQAVQFHDMGAIRPVNDVITDMRTSGDLQDFVPGSVDRLRVGNDYVAVPWNIDLRVWFYNKDLFTQANIKPPETWTELREAAKALTKDGRYGLVGSGDTGGSHYLLSLILNNGGGLFNNKRELTFRTDRNREALEFMAQLVKDGSVHPASAGYDSDQRRRAFLQGQAAMILDGPGFLDTAPADQRNRYGVLPPLKAPHGDQGTIGWVNNIMVYEQTKNPEQVKTFLKWWSKNQKPLFTEGRVRSLPARASFSSDPYFQQDPARQFVTVNYVPVLKGTGTATEAIFAKLNAVEGEGVLQSLTQEILQGKDLAPALTRAEEKLKSIMRD